jgi:hypothetical protein
MDHPSIADQEGQIASGLPWGLVVVRGGLADKPFFWGDDVIPEIPIMPRDFRWGPVGTDGKGDCVALMRSWYKQNRGLIIPETPRDMTWQDVDPDRCQRAWIEAGFTSIPQHELTEGDCIMLSIRHAGRPNHVAIYLGGGLILHHPQNRLVVRETFGDWRRCVAATLRPPEAPVG